VNLIEDDEGQRCVFSLDALEEPGIAEKPGAVFRNVPVEIEAVRERGGDHLRQSRLSGLAGSGKKNDSSD